MLLYQPKKGYRYNSDTHFLYDFTYNFKPKGEVLDIGCGSGILGLLITRDFKVNTTMIEREERAFRYATINQKTNQIDAKVIHSDFLDYESEKKFDMVVSNPPFYLDSVVKSTDSALKAARYASELPFDLMVKKINGMIKPHGEFIFCYDAKQLGKVLDVLQSYKFIPTHLRFVHPHVGKESNLVLVRAKKSSRSPLKIEAPLIIQEGAVFSAEVQAIYKKSGTFSISGEL